MKVWIDMTAPRPRAGVPAADRDHARARRRGGDHRARLRADGRVARRCTGSRRRGHRPSRRPVARAEDPPDDRPARRAQALGEGPRLRRRARARLPRADDHGAPARPPELDDVRLRVRDVPAPARLPRGDAGRRPRRDPARAAPALRRQAAEARPVPGPERGVLPRGLQARPVAARAFDVDPARVLVVLRPPPDVSLYHRHSNPLFPQTLEHLGRSEDVQAFVLPRTDEQREYVRGWRCRR